MELFSLFSFSPVLVIVVLFLISAVKVINEYERAVIFRLGRVQGLVKGPGLIIVIPIVDRMVRVDLRVLTLDIPPQDIITRDNVTLKVNAVVYFKVVDPTKSVIAVENYLYATSQLAQTTLRSVLGEVELDQLLASREMLNKKLQEILEEQTEQWGVKVQNVEVKQIDLPPEMQRAMAQQAEAERERRAKVIAAEGEFQAAQKLSEAAEQMSKSSLTLPLRYLQTMRDVAVMDGNTIVFPFPIDFLKLFENKEKK